MAILIRGYLYENAAVVAAVLKQTESGQHWCNSQQGGWLSDYDSLILEGFGNGQMTKFLKSLQMNWSDNNNDNV